MPHGTGSYLPGTSASSDYFNTVDELLYKLPDNTANLIKAKDVRDSVFTLWHQIQDVNIIAASAASASAFFENPNPTPVTIGGIPAGSTFPFPHDMQTMWDLLLYPYIGPAASLSGGNLREFGTTPYGTSPNSITLSWSVTKNSNPITSITVDGNSIVPTGNNQAGTQPATIGHSAGGGVSETNTFYMSASDGTSTANASTTVTWMNKIYWGSLVVPGNPNLTTNPSLAATVATYVTNPVVLALSGAGVGSGNQLTTTKTKTYTNIDGGGNFLIFAWPSVFSGSTTPTFKVNGLPNTAFTSVQTAWPLTNINGFTTNYEVWVSNTVQNAPLFVEIS